MNWKDCVLYIEQYDRGDRFTWPPSVWGFDCEPNAFTYNDVWGAISWLWTYPGDLVISQEFMRTFFELGDQPVVATLPSIILGWFIFLTVLGVLGDW